MRPEVLAEHVMTIAIKPMHREIQDLKKQVESLQNIVARLQPTVVQHGMAITDLQDKAAPYLDALH